MPASSPPLAPRDRATRRRTRAGHPAGVEALGRPRLGDAGRIPPRGPRPAVRDLQARNAAGPPAASLPEQIGVARYLPAALLATSTVALLPAVLADAAIPDRGLGGALLTLAAAVLLSLCLASLEAFAWKRLHGPRGILFSDLMVWNFARRVWAERRLRRIGAAYAAAAGDGARRVGLLEGLSRLLETRNPYTYGHCRRVARHAERIARAMKLTPAEIAEVRTAALIHDVGKVYTPSSILHKAGALTAAEFGVIKRHCADGADMLAPVRDRRLAAIVRHHHERLDGSGYPDGLRGTEIPLGARIVAVADTFDAITSHRPYRRARSQRAGLEVLEAEAGSRLDAAAVAAFLSVYAPRRAVASVALSGAVWARLAPAGLLPGGLLGGASLAGVLPAVGAAGLLALAPASRYAKPPVSAGEASGPALISSFPGAPGNPSSPAPRRSTISPMASIGFPGARVRSRGAAPGGAQAHRGPASSLPAAARVPGTAGSPGGPPSGAADELLQSGRAGPPAVTTPTVTTPGATVPPLETPAGATPAIAVPAVAVPGVTVSPPSASAGSDGGSVGARPLAGATAPSVDIPGAAGR
jgi:putative nucleotidyltransferase with HDIG domain